MIAEQTHGRDRMSPPVRPVTVDNAESVRSIWNRKLGHFNASSEEMNDTEAVYTENLLLEILTHHHRLPAHGHPHSALLPRSSPAPDTRRETVRRKTSNKNISIDSSLC